MLLDFVKEKNCYIFEVCNQIDYKIYYEIFEGANNASLGSDKY